MYVCQCVHEREKRLCSNVCVRERVLKEQRKCEREKDCVHMCMRETKRDSLREIEKVGKKKRCVRVSTYVCVRV